MNIFKSFHEYNSNIDHWNITLFTAPTNSFVGVIDGLLCQYNQCYVFKKDNFPTGFISCLYKLSCSYYTLLFEAIWHDIMNSNPVASEN